MNVWLLLILPSKVPSLGVFVGSTFDLKNDYRSAIDITFIPDMVFHMVAILASNKGNG